MSGYRFVPGSVWAQIERCSTDTFYVGRTLSYSTDEIARGLMSHLGVGWDGQSVTAEPAVLPGKERGRWSRYNIDGRIRVRKDLPKVLKTIRSWESPNFGDWSKGSHTVSITREVYQRELWYAQRLPILIDVHVESDGAVALGFRVDRVFDRTDLNERDLLLACALLRENIDRGVSVVSSELSVADWLADQRVRWEILPPGEKGMAAVAARLGAAASSPRMLEVQDRYAAVNDLHPASVVLGDGGFSRYFGFMFRDDLVALENLDYGNALYLMYGDWEALSQRSRIDLLADTTANYDRIIHRSGWQNHLRELLMLHGHDVSGH